MFDSKMIAQLMLIGLGYAFLFGALTVIVVMGLLRLLHWIA